MLPTPQPGRVVARSLQGKLKLRRKKFFDGEFWHKEDNQYEVFDGSRRLGEVWKGMSGHWYSDAPGADGVRFRKRQDALWNAENGLSDAIETLERVIKEIDPEHKGRPVNARTSLAGPLQEIMAAHRIYQRWLKGAL